MKIKIEIEDKRIVALLASAFDGGLFRHWCRVEVADSLKRLMRGTGAFTFVVHDTGKTHVLSRQAILAGVDTMIRKAPRHFGDWLADRDDAVTADVFLQCCLFGEVIYG